MEVQAFLLAKEIKQMGPGSEYNGENLGLHHFFPASKEYPFEFAIPYYMLIRRATSEDDEVMMIRFNLIDSDGQSIGALHGQQVEGTFPAGHKFMTIVGKIKLEFPAPGDYRLDIISDEHKFPTTYTYNISVS